ncbi:E3 ubiquitin-protein ligase PRT1-like isoform X2 [Asparagus officinalis]|uniref:E3 ubiquitin-protein ligase PRT1-like isoform X2 n=1 Tax=Asparagus officinalis TaxID=4686 RepID=UPI00098E50D4|nr:E3 ubiquitin-protein ligase PRT1-like isoform X2 [Asparagus officinalis]
MEFSDAASASCGHVSCFWCVHKTMHGLKASCCAICRQQYYHFPTICHLLHLLLLKWEPLLYKSREKEILEEEHVLGYFSPRFVDHPFYGNGAKDDRDVHEASVDDVLCARCSKMLLRPSVLNCGHVYCQSCLCFTVDGLLRCQVCDSVHPGNFPKVCLEMDHFLEEQFPKEYCARRENLHDRKSQFQHADLSLSTLQIQEQNVQSSLHAKNENLISQQDLQNTNIRIGCDICGMYPIIGKRYRCKDCKEKVGFDVCEACYHTSFKLPGRFNQQHTVEHRLEFDDSRLLSKILMPNSL